MHADQVAHWLEGPSEQQQAVGTRLQHLQVVSCKDTALLRELLVQLIRSLPHLLVLHISGPLEFVWQPADEEETTQAAAEDSDHPQQQQAPPKQQQQQGIGPALQELTLEEACCLAPSGVAWVLTQHSLTRLRLCGSGPLEWVGALTQLRALDISSSSSKHLFQVARSRAMHGSIPEAISRLTQLQELRAGNLRLRELPMGITCCQRLRCLDLTGHRLTQQQLTVLGALQQLSLVDLSGRGDVRLGALPGGLEQLPDLNILRVAHQGLSSVGPLQLSTTLSNLDLCGNRWRGGQGLDHLSGLRVLSLAACAAGQLEGLGLEGLSRLEHLDLSSNKLSSTRGLGCMPDLQHLHLARNKLHTLRCLSQLGPLDRLTCLQLGYNPLQGPGVLLHGMRSTGQRLVHLDLTSIGLTDLAPWAEWMQHAPMLEQLVVRDNQSLEGLPGVGALPQRLTYFDCGSCGLSEVPEGLTRLTNLRHLVLEDNALETLPMWLSELKQLEVLDVWRCRLPHAQAAKVLGSMPALKQVRRDRSTLYHMPGSLKHLEFSQEQVFTR
jgi:Leucine-rich repeat (LRR) protein